MERLSFEKFQDVKIERKQMSHVRAGDCTGGGGFNYKVDGEWCQMNYTSDESFTVTGVNGNTITRITFAGVSFSGNCD